MWCVQTFFWPPCAALPVPANYNCLLQCDEMVFERLILPISISLLLIRSHQNSQKFISFVLQCCHDSNCVPAFPPCLPLHEWDFAFLVFNFSWLFYLFAYFVYYVSNEFGIVRIYSLRYFGLMHQQILRSLLEQWFFSFQERSFLFISGDKDEIEKKMLPITSWIDVRWKQMCS